jgi:hypothetical protein
VRVLLKCDAPTPLLKATPSIVGVVDGLCYCAQPVLLLNFCGKNTHWVRHLLCLDFYVVVCCLLSPPKMGGCVTFKENTHTVLCVFLPQKCNITSGCGLYLSVSTTPTIEGVASKKGWVRHILGKHSPSSFKYTTKVEQ